MAIYPLFENHGSFNQAVERVRELKGLRTINDKGDIQDSELFKLINKMSLELAKNYFIENGAIDPSLLPPETEEPSSEIEPDSISGEAKSQFGTSTY